METLIFKTVVSPRNNRGETIEFVQEGSFIDAMNLWDVTYPVTHLSDENEEFDSNIDSEGYYIDSNGEVIVTETELKNSNEHRHFIDNTFFRDYYTKNIDNLNPKEIEAVLNEGWVTDLFKENVLENSTHEVTENDWYDIEFNGKYYQLID